MAFITLAGGLVSEVDDADVCLLTSYKWYAQWNGKTKSYYAVCSEKNNRKRVTIRMQRLITGAGNGELVDHINRDTLDNRRSNLRVCTASNNSMNRSVHGSTCKFKGVTISKSGRWRARITINGKTKCIGSFPTPEEAAKIYDKNAAELFGEFALLNFP